MQRLRKKRKEEERRVQMAAVYDALGLIPTPKILHNEVSNDGQAAEDLSSVDGEGTPCPLIPDEFLLPLTE